MGFLEEFCEFSRTGGGRPIRGRGQASALERAVGQCPSISHSARGARGTGLGREGAGVLLCLSLRPPRPPPQNPFRSFWSPYCRPVPRVLPINSPSLSCPSVCPLPPPPLYLIKPNGVPSCPFLPLRSRILLSASQPPHAPKSPCCPPGELAPRSQWEWLQA